MERLLTLHPNPSTLQYQAFFFYLNVVDSKPIVLENKEKGRFALKSWVWDSVIPLKEKFYCYEKEILEFVSLILIFS